MRKAVYKMPNGLHLSDADFFRATITVNQYLMGLESYLERMLAFGATDEDSARRWFLQALTTLGYKDYATYEAGVAADTRIINPSPVAPGVITPAMVMPGLQLPASQSLPLFKQVVAPIVYRKEADRQAVQFGYVGAEGEIINETAYNTLIRKSMQSAEQYKVSYITEWLDYSEKLLEYDKKLAEIAEDTAEVARIEAQIAETAKKRQAAHVEAWDWMTTQRVEARAEEVSAIKEQERAEAWAKETETWGLGKERRPPIPTGEKVVREFLEEERPGKFQEFVRGKLPSVLEEFEREMGGARRAWWRAINRPTAEAELSAAEREVERWKGVIETGVKKGLKPDYTRGAYEMTPTEWLVTQAPQRLSAAQEALARLQGRTPEQMARREPSEREDPLAGYLAQYPWQAEWFKLSPQQRGFQPTRFAPAAKWFV